MTTSDLIGIKGDKDWLEWVLKVQPSVSETAKQLITLSSGVLTLMIAFSNGVLKPELTILPKLLAIIGWICFVASASCGIMVLKGLSICLDPKLSTEGLWKEQVVRFFKWQGITFLFALFFTMLYGILAVFPLPCSGVVDGNY
jgi:hypothetical protein